MKKYVTIHTQCVNKRGEKMEIKDKIKELQEMIEARRIARNKAIVKVIVFLIKMFLVLILLDILILNIYFVEPVERIIESIYMSVGEGILYISKLIAE